MVNKLITLLQDHVICFIFQPRILVQKSTSIYHIFDGTYKYYNLTKQGIQDSVDLLNRKNVWLYLEDNQSENMSLYIQESKP